MQWQKSNYFEFLRHSLFSHHSCVPIQNVCSVFLLHFINTSHYLCTFHHNCVVLLSHMVVLVNNSLSECKANWSQYVAYMLCFLWQQLYAYANFLCWQPEKCEFFFLFQFIINFFTNALPLFNFIFIYSTDDPVSTSIYHIWSSFWCIIGRTIILFSWKLPD